MLKKIGHESVLTDDYDLISQSKIIIFPGVGKFDATMEKIYEKKIDKAILNAIENNSKLLGICIGMHALFSKSEEGNLKGLGLIEGEVKKFKKDDKFKIPHMGWNHVNFKKNKFDNKNLIENYFYFVHSYYVECYDSDNVLGTTEYSQNFVSAVNKEKIFGVQFHPEKSHFYGKEFLNWFLN